MPALSKSVATLLAGQALGRGIRFIGMNLVLARLLGPESFGALALAMLGMQILSSIGSLGMYNGLQHFAPLLQTDDGPGPVRRLIAKALLLSTLGATATGILWLLATPTIADAFDNQLVAASMQPFSLALPFFAISTVTAFAFNSIGKPLGYTIFRDIAPYVFMFLGIGAWTVSSFSLERVCVGAASGIILWGVLSTALLWMSLPRPGSSSASLPSAWTLVRFSLPTAITAVASLIYLQSDRVMLGLLSSEADVGIYSVCSNMSMQLLVVPGAIAISLAPRLMILIRERGMTEAQRTYASGISSAAFVGAFLGCLIILFPTELLSLVGQEYTLGSGALQILTTGALCLGAPSVVAGYSLSICGKPKTALIISVASASINIGLNSVLIPRYGLSGAAIATCTALAVTAVTASAALNRHAGFRPWQPGWSTLASAIVAMIMIATTGMLLQAPLVAALCIVGIGAWGTRLVLARVESLS